MKILFCAYRDWALKAYDEIWHQLPDEAVACLVNTPEELEKKFAIDSAWDLIVLIGWSWKVSPNIVNSTTVIGMHPSDLPNYAGGSPLQHQIIDGLTESKATLFQLTENFDDGPILRKVPFSLKGNLKNVLESLTFATIDLVVDAIKNHPNHTKTAQNKLSDHVVRRRLKPNQSQLTNILLKDEITVLDLYNEIRCREDPYPNSFIEDGTGKLYFKEVYFEPK